ncbi:MAG: nucleotidyltransferase family protein [Rhodothermales bacterium]
MFDPERDEHHLILACAKPQGYKSVSAKAFAGKSTRSETFDWQYVLRFISRHRIAPLLYYFLSNNPEIHVPEEISARLKKHASEQAVTNLFQTQELIRVLALFEDAGLEAMPFKGPALGHYLYNNLGIRPFGDLDILIRKEAFPQIKTILMANGYNPYRTFTPEKEAAFIDTQMGFEFVREDEQSVIEVHWSFLNTVHAFKLSEEDVWRDRTQLDLSGKEVDIFSPAHLLVYLCAHGSKSLWARMRWICDVAELVTKHQDEQFWNTVQEVATQSRSKRMLHTGLRLASELLDTPLPKPIAKAVKSDIKAILLANEVITSFFASNEPADQELNPISFHLKMQERFRDRLPYYKHIFQLWSKPSTKDKDFVDLPRYLGFLYIFVKPIRMMLNRGR